MVKREEEEKRLTLDNINRPSTKWVFVGHFSVNLKVVLTHDPLLGTGPLPDWLCNLARGSAGPIVALDSYQDNLCLWRCIGSTSRKMSSASRE